MNTERPESKLTEMIIGCAFGVYNELGAGYPEKVYQKAMQNRLKDKGLEIQSEQYCKVLLDDKRVGHFFIDILVNNIVVVELKARGEI